MSGTGSAVRDRAIGFRLAERGFTLIELLVTLAISTLVSGILFPRIEQSLHFFEWRSASDGIEAALVRGRADALRTGAPINFAIGGAGSAYAVSDDRTVDMPTSVRAAVLRASRITFYRDGTSSGGVVRVAGAGRALLLAVSPDTGLVRRVE